MGRGARCWYWERWRGPRCWDGWPRPKERTFSAMSTDREAVGEQLALFGQAVFNRDHKPVQSDCRLGKKEPEITIIDCVEGGAAAAMANRSKCWRRWCLSRWGAACCPSGTDRSDVAGVHAEVRGYGAAR